MKKIITKCLLCIMVFTMSQTVFAKETLKSEKPVTMEDINSNETEIIYVSDETIYLPATSSITPYAVAGQYPIYTRVTTSKSSSNGVMICSSKSGKYSSIASTALSFFKSVPAMKISQIFSVISLIADSNQYCQGRTMKSYVDYQKNGQARWSDGYYNTYVFSGKREYYKHVLGGKQNSKGQWTTKTKDYLSSPAAIDQGNFYTKNDSWFKEQASQRILTGSTLYDLPW